MNEFLLIAGIHILGAASPGPDLALVLKNSLGSSRKIGVYTALGIAIGILIHLIYSIAGLAVVISKSIVLFNVIKFVGAGYLIYIGLKTLKSSKNSSYDNKTSQAQEDIGKLTAFKQGFLTNILNPKVTLFFLSLFTQIINPETSNLIKIGYGIEMVVATFLWFSFVATMMTQKPVQAGYTKVKHLIDKMFGVALIALGIKVSLGSN